MNDPLVSILIPVFCRGWLACESIDCALLQDYPNFEIIIGDNCSDDGTYEILKNRYHDNSRVIMFQNETNLGAVENWIQCLKRAKGKYVKYLWSDDLMSTDCIRKCVSLLEQYPEASFAYSKVVLFVDKEEKDTRINRERLQEIGNRKRFYIYAFGKTGEYNGIRFVNDSIAKSYKMPVSPGCAVFKREKVFITNDIPNTIGYNHKNNGAGPDILMFLNALANNETFIYIDEPLNYFREHEGSISSRDLTIKEGYNTALIYYIQSNKLDKLAKYINAEIVKKTIQFPQWIYRIEKNDAAISRYYDDLRKTPHGPLLVPILLRESLGSFVYRTHQYIKKRIGKVTKR